MGKVIHGYSGHKLYKIIRFMLYRCYDQRCKNYRNYGGRGIIVCRQWREDPISFIEWALQNGWQEGLQVDRIDNNGNYEPYNCRFVTREINQKNRRLSRLNVSGYAGVDKYIYQSGKMKWRARIKRDGINKHIGYFDTPEQAHKARQEYIFKRLYGRGDQT